MTADQIRAELLVKALRAMAERYNHTPGDGPPGVAGILESFAREWSRAESDADTAERPVYPPAGVWDDEVTEPIGR